MRHNLFYAAAALLLASAAPQANADSFQVSFAGPGVSGNVSLTYGTATDSKVPQGFEVTGASGTFSDTNIGIINAPILGLIPINPSAPDPTNLLAPADFSRYPVATGLAQGNSLSYDNLFYPGGSPPTASDYPFGGGFLDIYGLLFNIGGGEVVNFWSNGLPPGSPGIDYGIAVANSAMALDYVSGGVEPTPEPGTLCLLGTGIVAAILQRRPAFLRR